MKGRKADLLRLSAIQFTAWELHLYLDTHPDDREAKEKYDRCSKIYKELLEDFERKYGPITMPARGVEWLKDPWPWENTGECDD